MEKTGRKILWTSALFAFVAFGASVSLAKKEPISASADSALQTQLLSPLSYEEYLPITAPADVSISENRMAIADGKVLYVYDKAEQTYREYVHGTTISELQLAGESVYFLDGADEIYALSLSASPLSAQNTGFSCRTFAIEGDSFYCRKGGNVFKYSLGNLNGLGETVVSDLSSSEYTPLAFWQGNVCYFKGGLLYQAGSSEAIAAFPYAVSSMTVTGNLITFTSGGNLYAYNLDELNTLGSLENAEQIAFKEGNYKSVTSNGDEVLAVSGQSVWQFSVGDAFGAEKEICLSSPSENRLNGATALALSGGKLFTADNGNSRLSVYDVTKESYLIPLATELAPTFLAAYGDTVLLSNAHQAALYSLAEANYGEELLSLNGVNGRIVGVTAVYDKYYLLTNTNHCYVYAHGETGWTVQTHVRKNVAGKKIASDVYGYLYILTDTAVWRFTETAFLDPNGQGEQVISSLPDNPFKEMLVDYDRNIYLLAKDSLVKYTATGNTETFSLGAPLVYNKTPSALSFALGADNNTAYLLFDGDYVAKTGSLALPAMSTLPAKDAYAQIYQENANFGIVTTAPGAVLIEFSVADLTSESEVFPYVAFTRFPQEQRAIKMGSAGKYDILTLVNKGESKCYLALSTDVSEGETSEYYLPYEQTKTGYVVSEAPLLKYPVPDVSLPCLSDNLPRDGKVEIKGEYILDRTYYQIIYTDRDGKEVTGYLPAAFVSLFDGSPQETQEKIYGADESKTDWVWRLWYILLGMAAIGILIDYLLLRSRKEDKEDKEG